jgi:hypothetical protein
MCSSSSEANPSNKDSVGNQTRLIENLTENSKQAVECHR